MRRLSGPPRRAGALDGCLVLPLRPRAAAQRSQRERPRGHFVQRPNGEPALIRPRGDGPRGQRLRLQVALRSPKATHIAALPIGQLPCASGAGV